MISKIVYGALGLFMVYAAFAIAPDLRRYLKIRAM
jgi:hypothetical protein